MKIDGVVTERGSSIQINKQINAGMESKKMMVWILNVSLNGEK